MAEDKVHKVMGEFKRGTLHSGTGKKGKKGKKVTKRDQAVAIAMSEAGLSNKSLPDWGLRHKLVIMV